ncbi:hypothetical protein LXL04_000437 [Taraxacum kok-saghyz]
MELEINIRKSNLKSSPEESSDRGNQHPKVKLMELEIKPVKNASSPEESSDREREKWSWSLRSSEWRSSECWSRGRRRTRENFWENLIDPYFERVLGYLNVGPGRI